MTKPIYVDHAALGASATNFAAHHKTFLSTLTELEDDLQPLVNSWSGAARDLYVEKQQAWHTAALDLAELLGSIAKLTGDAHANYSQVVTDLTTAWT